MARYSSYTRSRDFSKKKANPNNKLPLDKVTLQDLLSIQAGSGEEAAVLEYIVNFISANKINCTYKVDQHGNMFITKGKSNLYPCVVAHMDEVCPDSSVRIVVELNNVFIGINPNTGEHAGCPGDDRVGVYTALELLRSLDAIKVCFFVEEEIGATNGSQKAPLTFFSDCTFILQADRASDNELIYCSNGGEISSEEWRKALTPLAKEYDYDWSDTGTFTDCGVLSKRDVGICCMNLGAAYFDNHSMDEKVCITGVENVLNIMFRICNEFAHRRWENKHSSYWDYHYNKYDNYQRYGNGNYGGNTGFDMTKYRSGYREDEYDFSDFEDLRNLSNKDRKLLEQSLVSGTLKENTDLFSGNEGNIDYKYVDAVAAWQRDEIPCLTCKTYDCGNCKFADINY